MGILMILGLIGMGIGTAISAYGVGQQNKEDERVARLKAQQEAEAQDLYLKQQQTTQAQIQTVEKLSAIEGTKIAYAGRSAIGSTAARAGVGNVGGASVARQALTIRKQMGMELTGLNLQTKQTVMGLETQAFGQGLEAKWAGERSKELTAEADWLKKYGWMSVVGTVASGAGQMAMAGAGYAWPGGGKPATVPSPTGDPFREW